MIVDVAVGRGRGVEDAVGVAMISSVSAGSHAARSTRMLAVVSKSFVIESSLVDATLNRVILVVHRRDFSLLLC